MGTTCRRPRVPKIKELRQNYLCFTVIPMVTSGTNSWNVMEYVKTGRNALLT